MSSTGLLSKHVKYFSIVCPHAWVFIYSVKDIENWCTIKLKIPSHECTPRKFNYNEAVAPLKSWILYSFLQPTDWPSKDFGTIFNHFASRRDRLTEYSTGTDLFWGQECRIFVILLRHSPTFLCGFIIIINKPIWGTFMKDTLSSGFLLLEKREDPKIDHIAD